MKYIVLLCDGMSDHKIESLGGKTVMEFADTPMFDYLADNGKCGFIKTTPDGMYPGSDICNLSIFGYNPSIYYTGRSPLEAASIGINLGENDFAFRCNLVSLSDDYTVMDDFSAHHIDNDSAKEIICAMSELFKDDGIEFYSGVGYRNLMVIRDSKFALKTTPPHDIMGRGIADYLPTGEGSALINDILLKGREKIKSMGTYSANAIWLWGEGKRPALDSFKKLYNLDGSVIAAVDLIKGIGKFAGLNIINVPGATGFIDTNYEGKAEYAIKSLEENDYVFIHVEAPDEAGHMGKVDAKIQAVEDINKRMLPIILDGLKQFPEYRLLITPDHPTPVHLRTHVAEPVPALIYGTGVTKDSNKFYNESMTPSFFLEEGYKIAEYFIKSKTI